MKFRGEIDIKIKLKSEITPTDISLRILPTCGMYMKVNSIFLCIFICRVFTSFSTNKNLQSKRKEYKTKQMIELIGKVYFTKVKYLQDKKKYAHNKVYRCT